MPAAVRMRTDFSASELRRLAAATKNANQSRRLLSLAAILDGMSRTEAARIGGMDRQTLRDWVHRFNERGPAGLKDIRSKGHPSRLSAEQQGELTQLIEMGPDRALHGVVRWRRVDLKHLIAERFGVAYHERTAARSCTSSASATSALARAIRRRTSGSWRSSKKFPDRTEGPSRAPPAGQAGRDLVPGRGAHRPEERDRAAVGPVRLPPAPARGSALRQRLPVRGYLSGARHGSRFGDALRRH